MTEESEVQEEQPVVAEEQQEEVQESPQDRNWARANEVMAAQKARIQELEAHMMQAIKPPAPVEEKDELDSLDDDATITKKQAESLAYRRAKEAAKQIVDEYTQKSTIAQDEAAMRDKHEDYDYVIENFALPLIKKDPALAHKIKNSPNPAKAAYKLGKISDEYEEQMTKAQTNPKAAKVLKNTSRPVSGNAVSPSLKNQAEEVSKMSPQEIWAMSQKFARSA